MLFRGIHLLEMIQAGLGLLPEPGKHEISSSNITAEKLLFLLYFLSPSLFSFSLSLSLSLSLSPSLSLSLFQVQQVNYCPSKTYLKFT